MRACACLGEAQRGRASPCARRSRLRAPPLALHAAPVLRGPRRSHLCNPARYGLQRVLRARAAGGAGGRGGAVRAPGALAARTARCVACSEQAPALGADARLLCSSAGTTRRSSHAARVSIRCGGGASGAWQHAACAALRLTSCPFVPHCPRIAQRRPAADAFVRSRARCGHEAEFADDGTRRTRKRLDFEPLAGARRRPAVL